MTKWKLKKAREERWCYLCDLHGKREVPAAWLLRWQFSDDDIGVQMMAVCDAHMIERSPFALGLEPI